MQIFLNVATLERHWLGHIPELMERAISVAGSLAALCAEQRLPVGLIANGYLPGSDQPLRLLPGRSPDQLMRILELLAARPTGFAAQPIEELLLHESPRLPWGSTLLVVTAIAHETLLATLLDLQRAGRRDRAFHPGRAATGGASAGHHGVPPAAPRRRHHRAATRCRGELGLMFLANRRMYVALSCAWPAWRPRGSRRSGC